MPQASDHICITFSETSAGNVAKGFSLSDDASAALEGMPIEVVHHGAVIPVTVVVALGQLERDRSASSSSGRRRPNIVRDNQTSLSHFTELVRDFRL